MSKGHMQIAGQTFEYHNSYRTKLLATRTARKLTKQGYLVRIMKFEDWEVAQDIFDMFPQKYDVWKRKR